MSKVTDLIKDINTALGTKALSVASDSPRQKYVPTGLLPFDLLLNGGFPRGRMSELYGAPSALKSYVGLCAIREAQKEGGIGALIDTEKTFDPDWAQQIGVDLSKLIIWPPEDDDTPITGENAIDTSEALLRSHAIDVLVFDSVAAALPQALMGQRMSGENIQPGRLAAMMSVGLRKLTAANRQTAMIWINQLRQNIGVTFGNPENPSGGKSLPYYASVRVNIKAAGKITTSRKVHDGEKMVDGKVTLGTKYRATVDKSKLYTPHGEVIFTWLHKSSEIDEVSFLVSQALESGAVTQAGAMWETEGLKVRGREKFLLALPEHPDVIDKLVARVMPSLGTGSG